MTVNDVGLTMQPSANHVGFVIQPSDATRRLTFQHFSDIRDPATEILAPHNSDARQSDSNEWPPPLIFDVAYGCAALKTWGVPLFRKFARGETRDIYYNNGNSGDEENGGGGESGDLGEAKRIQQAREREPEKRRLGQQASDSTGPDFADMVLALWMYNARKGRHRADAVKVDRTQEKVQTWLDSVE